MASQFTSDIICIVNEGSIFKSELIHELYNKSYEIERLLFYAEDIWFSEVKFFSSGHV